MAQRVGQPASRRRGGGNAVSKPGIQKANAKSTPNATLPRLLYSISEAAVVLGIPRSRAYELVRRGIIPTIDDYGRKMVPARLLEQDVERRVQLAVGSGSSSSSGSGSGSGSGGGSIGGHHRLSA
jgi:excisionase family DNA binding protein